MKLFLETTSVITVGAGSALLGTVFGWEVGLGVFLISWDLIPIYN